MAKKPSNRGIRLFLFGYFFCQQKKQKHWPKMYTATTTHLHQRKKQHQRHSNAMAAICGTIARGRQGQKQVLLPLIRSRCSSSVSSFSNNSTSAPVSI
jgi:hypothetical protein